MPGDSKIELNPLAEPMQLNILWVQGKGSEMPSSFHCLSSIVDVKQAARLLKLCGDTVFEVMAGGVFIGSRICCSVCLHPGTTDAIEQHICSARTMISLQLLVVHKGHSLTSDAGGCFSKSS